MAQSEEGGAGKVLRPGEDRASAAHAAVPGLVSQGQLCQAQEEEEEEGCGKGPAGNRRLLFVNKKRNCKILGA